MTSGGMHAAVGSRRPIDKDQSMTIRVRLSSSTCRRGFTLVELLVVIAIIGTLVGLLLPAVQAARESARRSDCTNRVRQMAQGMQNLAGTLPQPAFISAGYAPKSTSGKFWVTTVLYWSSVNCSLLPFLEGGAELADYQLNNYVDGASGDSHSDPSLPTNNNRNIGRRRVQTFRCPSDAPVVSPGVNYVWNTG
jgi:prepilin-type N-terminal cleavage/methylation domain-containing protein